MGLGFGYDYVYKTSSFTKKFRVWVGLGLGIPQMFNNETLIATKKNDKYRNKTIHFFLQN